MLTSLAPSPIASVTVCLLHLTSWTTCAFCSGVTRQQMTVLHIQQVSSSSCSIFFSNACSCQTRHWTSQLQEILSWSVWIPDSSPPERRSAVARSRHSGFRSAIAKVCYRKDPHMQNSMRKLKLTLTLVLTTDPNRYRRRCPDPNARIHKFIYYNTLHDNSGHLR